MQAIVTRLGDCDVKVLITANGYTRSGRVIDMKRVADAAVDEVSSVKNVVVVRHLGRTDTKWVQGRDYWWHDLMAESTGTFPAEPMDSEDPFMIIYTSDTTGKPKGCVHVHAGFPLKAAQVTGARSDWRTYQAVLAACEPSPLRGSAFVVRLSEIEHPSRMTMLVVGPVEM